ncbi:MAG: class I SAM-dependent methyltransferase [Synergistaceae bacterium]|nr:class I SAM-dependent methyltransferase [Synergistaceae bacterium]
MPNPVRAFINFNKKCYFALLKFFPNTKFSIYTYYREQVKANLRDEIVILDIGGGKHCAFAEECRKFDGVKIIALDVSSEELEYNHDADEKIVADIASGARVPLDDASADLVTSSSVLEHLHDLDSAVKEVSRILKPGGKFISELPCKFALFSVINQMLPNWLARKILFSIFPEVKGFQGFKAYYDRCYYPALKNLLSKHGFTHVDFRFSYGQAGYFSFFVPFALIVMLWDFLMYIFRAKTLSSYVCFTAEKAMSEYTSQPQI